MTALTKVASFVQSDALAAMPAERLEVVKRHVIDTWAAQVAGSRTEAGTAVSRLADPARDATVALVARCAQARCTEIDDIHLASCTTPGSVVVPTAIWIATARAASGESRTRVRDFCAAVLAGYESMIRLGIAIGGPAAMRAGVWPTSFAAAFGSAAAAARLLSLSVDETAAALSTSLTFAQERATPGAASRSSRWLSLGVAAMSGVLAARGARAGLHGGFDAAAWSTPLTRRLEHRYLFDDIGMKPYPTARQGLAAIEAARSIVEEEQVAASAIDRIVVDLPEQQRAIVDRAGFPASRFESIVNVRYQIALAIAAPDLLLDVVRTPPVDRPAVRRLMAKIRVTRGRDLERHYPRAWPARVRIGADGRCHVRTVLHPRGDARCPLDWSAVAAKAIGIAAPVVGASATERLVHEWRAADGGMPMPLFP